MFCLLFLPTLLPSYVTLGRFTRLLNLSRLYFTLIVLSLSRKNVSFLLPSVGFIVFFIRLCRLQLFALRTWLKETVTWKKKHSLTLHLTINCHLNGAAEYWWFKLFYCAEVVCCRQLENNERQPEGSEFKGMNKYEIRKPTVGFSTKHSSLIHFGASSK